MLKIYPQSIIYVHAPSKHATGGVELLHQLVSYLRDRGKEAYIVFLGECDNNVHSAYLKYNIVCKAENEIEDSKMNIEVYSETMGYDLMNNKRKTQKLMWWMSVDNFYQYNYNDYSLLDMYVWDKTKWWGLVKHRIKMLFRYHKNEFSGKIDTFKLMMKGCTFGYQCEYIRAHLKKKGIFRVYPLSDYINTDFNAIHNGATKENIVLYNPAKGIEYTEKLISLTPEIQWVALKDLKREELVKTLQTAKLYIDFGNHPGKDRLPRECAINGCCIITGKRGSAAYKKDINIPSYYKFDEATTSKEVIIEKIKYVLENYNSCYKDFYEYRQSILLEKENFEKEIENIFV